MSSSVVSEEPYGTTPLPVHGSPVEVVFDEMAVIEKAQQPRTSSITVFPNPVVDRFISNQSQSKSTADEEDSIDPELLSCYLNGTVLDVNGHFVVYSVNKNGLIRVLHRHSSLRSLLRGHANQIITDIQFFHNGDVLASAGHCSGVNSSVMIWRVFERSPEILSEVLLEITTANFKIMRVVWHPFNPNQFFMVHGNETNVIVATLVETTRIATTAGTGDTQHAVCDFYNDYVIMQGAVQLAYNNNNNNNDNSNLTDLCWSGRETRHVLTTHSTGEIVLWDLKKLTPSTYVEGTVNPACLQVIRETEYPNLSRCLFLPHDDVVSQQASNNSGSTTNNAGGTGKTSTSTLTSCFVTASDNNRVLTVWSPFKEPKAGGGAGESTTSTTDDNNNNNKDYLLPFKVQVLKFANPASSYLVGVCFGPAPADASPPSCFLVAGARDVGKIFAFSLKAQWSSSSSSSSNNNKAGQGNNEEENNNNKKALLVGCDYVVPFVTKYPTYAWSVMASPTSDIADDDDDDDNNNAADDGGGAGDENQQSQQDANTGTGLIFDMKLFCYQSHMVQSLTLTALSCLPPENSWTDPTPGVSYTRLCPQIHSAHVSDIDSKEDTDLNIVFDEEEYDIDDDIGDDYNTNATSTNTGAQGKKSGNDEFDAPEASALPPPDGFGAVKNPTPPAQNKPKQQQATPLANNPFANWLGAIASKATGAAPPMPTPPMPTPPGVVVPPPPGSAATATTAAVTAAGASVPVPPPPGLGAAGSTSASSTPSAPVEEVVEPPQQQPFLSPIDLLKGSDVTSQEATPAAPVPAAANKKQQQQESKKNRNKQRKSKSPKPAARATQQQQQPQAILKRKEEQPSNEKTQKAQELPAAKAPQSAQSAAVAATTAQLPAQPSISEDEIRQVVKEEFRDTILPQLERTVQNTLNTSVVQPLQSSITLLGKEGVRVESGSVDEPLKAAFADSVKNVLIPTLESVTSQVFVQISEHLEQGLSSKRAADDAAEASAAAATARSNKGQLDSISKQLTTMTALVTELTNEVKTLRAKVDENHEQAMTAAAAASAAGSGGGGGSASGAPPSQPSQPPAVSAMETAKNEIATMLSGEKYEAAFTKAVSASTAELVLYCCANSDMNKVLGGSSPQLSQPILLCLMQQLGAVFSSTTSTNLDMEVEWLQEISLCLDPSHAQIHNHVPVVLQQVVAGISQRLAQTTDPALRRRLQRLLQVVRGMQMG